MELNYETILRGAIITLSGETDDDREMSPTLQSVWHECCDVTAIIHPNDWADLEIEFVSIAHESGQCDW